MKKSLFSILFMFMLTLIFTGVVSGVKLLSEDKINRNQQIKLQLVIMNVLDIPIPPDADDKEIISLFQKRVQTAGVDGKTVYVARRPSDNAVQGIAFPVGGSGFWGPIQGLMAVSPNADKVTGLAFYKHSETPGLGARMTEKWFTDQFKGLKIQSVPDGKKFFYLKPEGSGQAPNELDAITGASRTSAAVELFLNRDIHAFLDGLWGDLKQELEKNG